MLYDAKRWDRPVRHDPLSLQGLIAWLETKSPEETYRYVDIWNCVLAQYFRAQGFWFVAVGGTRFNHGIWQILGKKLPESFRKVARESPRTFGAALERARALAG